MEASRLPIFDFTPSVGYGWFVDRGLVGFEPNTALQPWYFLSKEDVFSPTDRWPSVAGEGRLVAFSRRQDTDDIACFRVVDHVVVAIVMIHAWTPEGFQVVGTYGSFWEWIKQVVDDIAELCAATG
jgi:hypothetical protein